MTIGTGANSRLVIQRQAAFGTSTESVLEALEAQSNAQQNASSNEEVNLRTNADPTVSLSKEAFNSSEKRDDDTTTLARHGAESASVSWTSEIFGDDANGSTHEYIFEAVTKNAASAADAVSSDAAADSSLGGTAGTDTIQSSGTAGINFVTEGYKVGDIIRLTGDNAGADNLNRNLRIISMTTTTLVVDSLPADFAAKDSGVTITRAGKKFVQDGTPDESRNLFSFELYNSDLDESEVADSVRLSQVSVGLSPNANASLSVTGLGRRKDTVSGASAPFYTAIKKTATTPMTAIDGRVLYNRGSGLETVATLTGLTIDFNIGGEGVQTIGSTVTPDIFRGNLSVTGSVSGVVDNANFFNDFRDETEVAIAALLEGNEAVPKAFWSFYLPRIILTDYSQTSPNTGPMTFTASFIAGRQEAGTGKDFGMAVIQSGV